MSLARGTYLGKPRRTWHSGRLTLVESAYGEGAELHEHAHSAPHICVVLDGDYIESYGRRRIRRSSGDVIYLPAHLEHAERHDRDGRHFLIEWNDGDGFGDEFRTTNRQDGFRHAACAHLVDRIKRELHQDDAWLELVLEGLSLELIGVMSRISKTPPRVASRWFADVQEVLRTQFAAPLTLSVIAGSVALHPAYLARAYRLRSGETVMDSLRTIRVKAAAECLLRTDKSVSDIAAETGFCDHSHLTRTFVRATGMTPSRFRSLARGARLPESKS